jgi:replicative DNA helicase
MNLNDIHGVYLPPHSIEHEQAVIAALLKWPEKMDDLTLAEADFFSSAHRSIFSAIRGCMDESGASDMMAVADRMNDAGELDRAGGLSYLVELMGLHPALANLNHHVKGLVEKSRERGLVAAANEITQIVSAPGKRYAEKLAQAQSLLMGVETSDAQSEAISLRDSLKQMVERIDRVHSGAEKRIETGFTDLDEKIVGLGAGDMIVVAGRPSMGKTAFALQIAEHVSETEPVLVFSLEMSGEALAMRQAASVGRVDLMKMRTGDLTDDDWQRLTYATAKLQARQMFIDDRSGLSMHQMRARARQTKRKHGLGLIVVDYIGLIHGDGENRVNVVSEISRQIKNMARELGVPVIALSQLNRGLANRPDKRPMMSDLRDSGSIEQDADVIILLHRDEYYNPDSEWKGVAEAIIAKQRNGPTGMVPLSFIAEFAQFGNFAGRYDPERETKQTKRGFQ